MGKDKFIELIKRGLEYEHGVFYIKDLNRVEKIKDILSDILNAEIAFPQTCLICGREFLCLECKYYEVCESRDLPFHCICKNCYEEKELYDLCVRKGKK